MSIDNFCFCLEITGYIKTVLALRESRNMSCGIGAITDGHYKINIQITKFDSSELRKGQNVTVIGVVQNNGDDTLG